MTFFKGKKMGVGGQAGRISGNHGGRRIGSASFFIVCRLADSLFICYLACIAKGAAGGKELVIF